MSYDASVRFHSCLEDKLKKTDLVASFIESIWKNLINIEWNSKIQRACIWFHQFNWEICVSSSNTCLKERSCCSSQQQVSPRLDLRDTSVISWVSVTLLKNLIYRFDWYMIFFMVLLPDLCKVIAKMNVHLITRDAVCELWARNCWKHGKEKTGFRKCFPINFQNIFQWSVIDLKSNKNHIHYKKSIEAK